MLFSCGSKKKIVSINKEDVYVKSEVVKDVQEKEVSIKTDTSKSTVTKSEKTTESVIKEIIFNDKGLIEKITERTDKSGTINSHEELVSVINELKESIKKEIDKRSVDSLSNITEKDTDFTKTSKNPIWHWVGGALFVCILLFFGWKVLLKG